MQRAHASLPCRAGSRALRACAHSSCRLTDAPDAFGGSVCKLSMPALTTVIVGVDKKDSARMSILNGGPAAALKRRELVLGLAVEPIVVARRG
jgi:hypothetical protein